MTHHTTLVLTAALTWLAAGVPAQDSAAVKVTRLTERIYLLTTDQGAYTTNSLASVGEDGILLVDTQSEDDAAALKVRVDAFGKGTPKYIINTHRHAEHIGGNALFGDEPVVIAHELMPLKLKSRAMIFSEFPRATFADITLSDSLSLYFNGEKIRLVAVPGSHDDNEIMVHFTESKVAHISSLANGFNFPSIDQDGNALKFPDCVAKALALLPHDVTLVSGHNRTGSWDDLNKYHEMLVKTTEIVKSGVDAGKDAATLKSEKVLEAWKSYAGSYVSVDDWIDYLVEALQPAEPKSDRKSVFEPLYHAWKERGAAAAVDLFRQLKRDQADQYECRDIDLLVIGDKLLAKANYGDAVVFLQADWDDFPQSDYAYYVAYEIARCRNELGNPDQAVEFCRKAIELKPDFKSAASLLDSLTKK